MSNRAVLGIDLGTTALKCAVFSDSGKLIAQAEREYVLQTGAGGLVEMPVDAYWNALREASREVSALARLQDEAVEIRGLAISAQGETLVPVGADGSPLRNAIVWLDSRATVEARTLKERFSSRTLYEVTGQPEMLAAWPAAKILWIARNEPAVFAATSKWLLLEDYIVARMTGHYVCEYSLATSTCYWDLRHKVWWAEMLAHLDVDESQLPSLVEPGSAVGTLLSAVADELGLSSNVVVCVGALDQACGAIGGGGVSPDVLTETTGAAVALCAPLSRMRLDPNRVMPCHYHGIPGRYMFHTFTSGGIVLKWYRDSIAPGVPRPGAIVPGYAELSNLAAQVPAGSEGVLVLPHFQGAMAPDNNDSARGVIVGLTLDHDHRHLIRALMESIAFVVRRNLDSLLDAGVAYDAIRALGGGARSRIWKQIEADVTKLPVVTTREPEAAALGAAILCSVTLGWYGDIGEAVAQQVAVGEIFEPDPKTSRTYEETYGVWRDAYSALVPVFPKLTSRSPASPETN